MQRRSFLAGTAGVSLMSSAQAQPKVPAILELRYFKLRNTMDSQRAKLTDFMSKTVVPTMQSVGAGPVGLFSSSIGPDAPFLLLLAQHATIGAFEQCWIKLNAHESLRDPAVALMESVVLPFERMEVQLLRGFPGFPVIETGPADEKRSSRIFELRTYESNTPASLAKKINMFQSGEIDLFRKFGLAPLFFGETIVGPKMPNLTYMVSFENLAAREANWRAFATSPEWKKMASTPGWADGEVVSNISNLILTPVAGSPIR